MSRGGRTVKTLRDVVDWGLCIGCGACAAACDKNGIELVNVPRAGIRPRFTREECANCKTCLDVCPGYTVDASRVIGNLPASIETDPVIGPVLEIWEGHATDPGLREAGSSGGTLSAIALYCMEKESMPFVLHTGTDAAQPCINRTVQSRSRAELLARTGSRYAPASPCEGLRQIEQSDRPCVFIGKPCDAAAVELSRRQRPELDRKLGLVLTFFCAGAPSTQGTLDLLRQMDMDPPALRSLRYRGNGWPGAFTAEAGERTASRTYDESWGFLQKYRPFRCHLCPDGLGYVADISCGDAWHRHGGGKDPGRSIVIVRTERGREILRRAATAGYVTIEASDRAKVILAQPNLLRKKDLLAGRLAAMRLLAIPAPRFPGFALRKGWRQLPLRERLRTVLGTLRRLATRGLWHRNRPDGT